jgi:LuxR family maltose regulon positive regulatory protein
MRVNQGHEPDVTGGPEDSAARSVDSFLEAKLHHPPVRDNWVARPRLLDQLELATQRPIALIAAPAGYGKTTLVAQWLARNRQQSRAAWISLDSGDNDPGRLWTHVSAALERVGCVVSNDTVHVGADVMAGVLPRIVNALTSMPDDVVILLDDFHFVHEPACHSQVELLLEHLPAQAHLVIITRADPGLRLGRIRASGRLAEIRADDLRFNVEEAHALLAVEHVRLSNDALSLLVQRTEGWPAGIYLACLSLAGRADPDGFVRQFTGDDRFVGEYLTEEVLSRQTDLVRRFITTVSILDRFSAPLCDFVRQTGGSAAILHDLERNNLFLVPLDEQRHWYRFHHFAAAVARAELEEERPDLVPELHARAARWFRDHGHIDEAIKHALAGGVSAEAALLMQANWLTYVDAGRAMTVRGWLDALGPPSITADPASGVVEAWMAALFGDETSLADHLQALSELQDYGPLPDGSRSVESAIAMIQGLFGYGGPVEMLAGAQRAVEIETDGHSPFYAIANLSRGHLAYVAGDLDLAASLLEKASFNDAAPAITRVLGLSALSLVEAERGRSRRSGELARASMGAVDAEGLRAVPQASLAYTALGQAQADEGNIDDALSTVEEGLLLRRRSPAEGPWGLIHHLLASARVALAAGQLSGAEEMVAEASDTMGRFQGGMGAMWARLEAIQSTIRDRLGEGGPEDALTDRELDVVRYLQGTLSLSEVAAELHLSTNTVKTHAKSAYRKLGAHSRTEAVRIARQKLLI